MFQTILTIHGYWRWVLLIIAIVAAAKYLLGLIGNGKVASLDKTIGAAFTWAMTLQFVLGVINIINFAMAGAFNPRIHFEHAFYGLIATGLAHAIPIRKDSRPDRSRFLMSLIFVVISLVLILFSVIRLRGNWIF